MIWVRLFWRDFRMPGFADDSRHRGSGVLFASESAAVEAREKPNCALRRRKAAGIPPLPFDSTAAEGLRNRLISREFVVLASDLPQSLQESRTRMICGACQAEAWILAIASPRP